MLDIDLFSYHKELTTVVKDGITFVKDPIRKKEIQLLPEELIRQCIIHYLIQEMSYPISFIQVERQIKINKTIRRFDIVVYDRLFNPMLLIECKSHKVDLNQETFDQIARYNLTINAPYLMVSNGPKSYACKIDFEAKDYQFISQLPDFPSIK